MKEHDSTEASPACGCCRRVPISYLGLDLETPIVGWERFFADRGVEVAADHLGRRSIARWVVADLLDEQRERETRLIEEAAAKAAELVQPVGVGVAAQEGMSAAESLMAAPGYTSLHDELGRPKPNFLDDEFARAREHQRAEQEAARRKEAQ